MPFNLRRIAEAQKKALPLVENPETKRTLERFLESSGPLVESAARDELQALVEEINAQLAPGARLRLVQEGPKVVPEIVSLGDDIGRGRPIVIDSDSISKVLVRMPSDVKTMAADAAKKAGTSMNSWTVNILERALVNLKEHQQGEPTSQSAGEDTEATSPSESEENTRE